MRTLRQVTSMNMAVKGIALVVAAAALVVLVYAVLAPSGLSTDMDHGSMWGMHSSYNGGNVVLILISTLALAASLAVAVLWKGYEPLPPSMMPAPQPMYIAQDKTPAKPVEPVEVSDPNEAAAHNYLVLRLLNGDERTMYKTIMDSGGEALQKDLMARTRMSNAKVSRILDRLSEKGIVVKDRYGSTNRIRIKLDR